MCDAHNAVGLLAPETSASGYNTDAARITSVRHDTSDVNEPTVVAADDAYRSSPAGSGTPQSRAARCIPTCSHRRDVTDTGIITHASPIDDRFRVVGNYSEESLESRASDPEYLDRFAGWNIGGAP